MQRGALLSLVRECQVDGIDTVDGGVTWKLWSTPFSVQDPVTGVWSFTEHTESQIQQAGKDMKAHVLTHRRQCALLISQVNAATTVNAVNAIAW